MKEILDKLDDLISQVKHLRVQTSGNDVLLYETITDFKGDMMEDFSALQAQVENLTALANSSKAAQDRAETLLVSQSAKIETETKAIADLTAQIQALTAGSGNQAAIDALADQIRAAATTLSASTSGLVTEENVVDPPASAPEPVAAEPATQTPEPAPAAADATPATEPPAAPTT